MSPATGAERGAHGDFPAAGAGLREEEAGNIGASDEQQQDDGNDQEDERVFQVANDGIGEQLRTHAKFFGIVLGIFGFQRFGDGGEIDVAQEDVVAAIADELDGADGRGGAIDVKSVSGEAFFEEHADAFFVVEDEDRLAAEDTGVERTDGGRKSGRRTVENAGRGLRGRFFFSGERQENGKRGAADRERFDRPRL